MLKVTAYGLNSSAKREPNDKKTFNTKIRNFHEKDIARIITVIFAQPQYIRTMVFNPMTTVSKQLLLQQWQTLHNNHENYEQYALIIKLVATTLTLLTLTFSTTLLVALLLLAVLWLQEGIWKTFQCRTANAIMAIEDKLALNEAEQTSESIQAYLVYQQWQNNRPTSTALVAEYVSNSLKPTVLYPYIPLMLVVVITSLFS